MVNTPRPLRALLPPLSVLVFFAVLLSPALTEAGSGVPGDGFEGDDDCGYLTGTSNDPNGFSENGGVLFFDDVVDEAQACFGRDDYFVGEDFGAGDQTSFAWNSQIGWLDFSWDEVGTGDVRIDPVTGEWTGYAWAERAGWVWFGWTCATCTQADKDAYHVTTDLSTGAVTGYAWSDAIGWIPFYGLSQELPPKNLTAYVSIIAEPSKVASDSVDLASAPYADGYQYYKVNTQFFDNDTGLYLTKNDFTKMAITVTPTVDSNVYMDQVNNTGDAIIVEAINPTVPACDQDSEVSGLGSCARQQPATGVWTFNSYVFSGSPTSNMLGIDYDGMAYDDEVSFFTDREGCLEIYNATPATCAGEASAKSKDDVFFNRSNSRNKFQIEEIVFEIDGNGSLSFNIPQFTLNGDGTYSYFPTEEEGDLKFKPRYNADNLMVGFPRTGGDYYEYIQNYLPAPNTPDMTLRTQGVGNLVTTENPITPKNLNFQITTQVDNDGVQGGSDNHLLLDTSVPLSNTINGIRRTDTITPPSPTQPVAVNASIYLGYSQLPSYLASCGGTCVPPTNTLEGPTAEQWVCDTASAARFTGKLGASKSCYFVGYLPRADRYADAEDLLVLGAITSTFESDLLEEDKISVLGAPSYIATRNRIFETVLRLTLGKDPSGPGLLDAEMNPVNPGSIISLMEGKLLFAKGDIYIPGNETAAFEEKTIVTLGGNVYINGDIAPGKDQLDKLGIIALRSDGQGGNVYVHPEVTNIYANLFLDGSFYSYSGDTDDIDDNGVPEWSSAALRFDTLLNQLYIFGSLVSRNTIGGAEDSAAGTWLLGDGTYTTQYDTAKEHDLNKVREYRLCYPLDESGNVLFEEEPYACNEGEMQSNYYDDETSEQSNAPFIIEYSPPSSTLPVFNTSGLAITTR